MKTRPWEAVRASLSIWTSAELVFCAAVHFRKRLSDGAARVDVRLAMTTSLVLRPRWTDPVMFLYDNSSALDDAVRNMDAFAGGNFAPSSCRNLIAPSAAYTSSKVTTAGVGEPGKQCSPSTASQGSGGASLPYGYYGSAGYYSCQVSHSHWVGSGVKPSAHSPASAASQHGDKYTDMTTPSAEDYLTSRAKEFTFYPGYSSSPYQPVAAGYLDVPVVQAVSGPSEHRNESSLLPVESYQPWAISASGWNAQAYSDKEHSGDLWKSSVPGKKKHHASDSSGMRFYDYIKYYNGKYLMLLLHGEHSHNHMHSMN